MNTITRKLNFEYQRETLPHWKCRKCGMRIYDESQLERHINFCQKAKHCKECKRIVFDSDFRDQVNMITYQLQGICQHCQDAQFVSKQRESYY